MTRLARATGANNPAKQISVTAANHIVNVVNAAPLTPQEHGAVGDGVTDDAAAFQAALDAINAAGGGTLYIPKGTYKISSYLTVYPKTTVRGAGQQATILTTAMAGGGGASAFENVRNGTVFNTIAPINTSTRGSVVICDLSMTCTNAANVGAGYMDRCNTFIQVKNVGVYNFKYGVIFDQTEIADIVECEFAGNTKAGVWIVNGASLNPGALGTFTNRIGIRNCQFNGAVSAGVYGIIDDGGYTHTYEHNNYNGCYTHIRMAGVAGGHIIGGEFEAAAGPNIWLGFVDIDGDGVGQCGPVHLDTPFLVPTGTNPAVEIVSAYTLVFTCPFFSGHNSPMVTGVSNVVSLTSTGAQNEGAGATYDGLAVYHWEVDRAGNIKSNQTHANDLKLAAGKGLYVNSVKVVGAQGAAVADATDAASVITQLNALLARCRAHGLIAT